MDASEPEPRDKSEETKAAPQTGTRPPFFSDPEAARLALENGEIGIWAWDIASNRVNWSSNLEAIHQLPERTFDETFAFFENDIHPEDRPTIISTIQEIVRTRKPNRMQYRLSPKPDSDECWIESLATVVMQDGAPVQVVGICRDISDRVIIHRELRMRALTENDLQKLFDEAVAMIAEILGVERVTILELVPGDAELILRAGLGFREGLVGTAHVTTGRETLVGFTLASGGPVLVDNLAAETRFSGPALLYEHGVISSLSIPIAGRDGRAYGVLGAHTEQRRKFSEYDVSFLTAVANVIAGAIQRGQLDHRQELMIRELRHRSGNLFSQLLALFSQTAKNSKNVADLVTKYEARVLALANAHRLVTEGGWKSASLTELLHTLLAQYLDRMSFSGPDVFLEPDPTFGVSMAVHELATNASTYGSLSDRGGRVEMTWTVNRTQQGLTLALDWKERGGPSPKKTRRPGFGSKLINMVIERQLNGEVQQTFEPEGLDTRLIVPLTLERWTGAVRPVSDPSEGEG